MKSDARESGPPRDNRTSTHPLFLSLTRAGRSSIGRAGLSLLIGAFVILLLSGCDIGGERFSPSTPTRVQPTSTVPSATGTAAPTASGSAATAVPASTAAPTATGVVLPVSIAAVPTDLPEYDRGTWGHWTDEDGDCQNARQEVLIDESNIAVTFQSEERCRVVTGLWEGPYTGTVVEDPGDLDVDHMVPLENAHRSGGWQWSRERKRRYANYLGYENHLIATTSGANRSKGSKGPEEWRPPLEEYWCTYATDWVSIKNEWGLTVTEDEYVALAEMLAACETTVLLQPAQGTPPSPPTPTVLPSLPVDLRYDPFGPDRDCGDFDTYGEALAFFLAAGGPDDDRHRLDVNGDGLPCESLPGGPSANEHDKAMADSARIAFVGIASGFECQTTGPPQTASSAGQFAPSGCMPVQAPVVAAPFSPDPTPLPTPMPTATPVPTPEPKGGSVALQPQPPAADANVNCADFARWPEAQEFFLAEGGPNSDPHGLDANDDGVACQSLPGAPSITTKVGPSGPIPGIASTPAPAPESTLVSPAFVGLPFDPDGADRSCGDFSSWWDAQNFYLASGGPVLDPHRLDQNKDGIACESLLGTSRSDSGPGRQDMRPAPTPTPQPVDDEFQDRNCSDFATWQQANAFFEAEGGPQSDRHRLDRNGDGVPCESLPGAPGSDSGPGRQDAQPAPTPTPQPDVGEFQDRNCSDFATWQEAQNFFLSEGGPSQDPHGLDRNGDGVPCESLPGAPGGESGPIRQDMQPTPTPTPQPDENEFQDRNCSDFDTWREAQDFFLSEGGPSQDPHGLDRNGDGIACESLPGAPGGESGPIRQDTQPTPTPTSQPDEDEFEDRNCSDFATWQEAQDFFLSEGGPSQDPHRLDGDGNGVACQSLPGAPDG